MSTQLHIHTLQPAQWCVFKPYTVTVLVGFILYSQVILLLNHIETIHKIVKKFFERNPLHSPQRTHNRLALVKHISIVYIIIWVTSVNTALLGCHCLCFDIKLLDEQLSVTFLLLVNLNQHLRKVYLLKFSRRVREKKVSVSIYRPISTSLQPTWKQRSFSFNKILCVCVCFCWGSLYSRWNGSTKEWQALSLSTANQRRSIRN